MYPLFKASACDPQFFFSVNFLMQVKLVDGSIEGWIVHYPIGLNLAESFRGIYVEENGLIKFSFFIEWNDPNLNDGVLTAYSGEMFNTGEKQLCLALDWLQVSEDRANLSIHSYKGCEVLRSLSENDPMFQAHRLALLDVLDVTLRRS